MTERTPVPADFDFDAALDATAWVRCMVRSDWDGTCAIMQTNHHILPISDAFAFLYLTEVRHSHRDEIPDGDDRRWLDEYLCQALARMQALRRQAEAEGRDPAPLRSVTGYAKPLEEEEWDDETSIEQPRPRYLQVVSEFGQRLRLEARLCARAVLSQLQSRRSRRPGHRATS